MRKILKRLFGALRSNAAGVLENEDVDLLHDFRVANRRTRTALSQTRGILPSSVMDTFQPEFKWLGGVTGPRRDLDVFLLDMDSYRHQSKIDDGALGPLEISMREKRRLQHGLVRAALLSEKFHNLIENWGRFLGTGGEEEVWPPLACSPIIEVACPRVLKAYRRMLKRGTGIEIEPPAALLHQLRIDGKKLRYLLEFFSNLYPREITLRFIRELKQLQDILGGFNDTVVQLALIREFAKQNTASAETLVAMDRLTELITERQRKLRSESGERFGLFASDESRKLYKKTFQLR
jgi:CHAD domain-containing protein